MKERSILFSGSMVRAILNGRKTQTRRVVKPQPFAAPEKRDEEFVWDVYAIDELSGSIHCPFGQPGTKLWVRESFFLKANLPDLAFSNEIAIAYAADNSTLKAGEYPYGFSIKKPSIHMPRWASRITLEITGVRVERLQDISEDDAIAEGVYQYSALERIQAGEDRWARHSFRNLWESINGTGSWELNPWVWVIEFKRVQP